MLARSEQAGDRSTRLPGSVTGLCDDGRELCDNPPGGRAERAYDRCMPSSPPTSLAVSDALTHYRQLRELTVDELAYVLRMLDHPISAEALAEMERCARPVTVDDLVAIAYALDTTPAVLLSHIPIDLPEPEGPLATGLPSDVDQTELRAWIEGETTLDRESRVSWWEERAGRLRVRSAHHEEQLQGAYAELRELGDLAVQEADAPPVQRLQWRIQDGEHALNQSEVALALTEHRLNNLREGA
ncbi:hypothetical protein GCM10010306_099000 [Streptomyces umbrinus]|nr:hypothetical protein GCM10010306_099000 [Streptomyces umbrinus]